MYFKKWCLSSYGISSISEGKVINRVFLPAIPGKSYFCDPLLRHYGGILIHYQGRQGLAFPMEGYEQLLLQFRSQFMHLHRGHFDVAEFELYKKRCLPSFDSENTVQYRIQPNVHLSFCNAKEKQDFLQRFASYHPFLSYDVLKQHESVEISSFFLNELYELYYQDLVSYKPSLKLMQGHKLRLEQLVSQIEKNNLAEALDSAQALSLDYDNQGSTRISSQDACSAYAMSLKIFAELHRFAFTQEEFRALYTLANLFAAYDRSGVLHQSLKTDLLFIHSIKHFYGNYLNSLPNVGVTHNLPLLSELPDAICKRIQFAINKNIKDLLYGNSDAPFKPESYCVMKRFLPDEQGHSEVDEIILQGGEMAGHFATFKLIKIGINKKGVQVSLNETPHYFEYFKVVNNLGANCYHPDHMTKVCLGTYVTRIVPCSYSESAGSFVHLSINPYTHPKEYQIAMENTLSKLIANERILQFYRKPSQGNGQGLRSEPGSKEALEWEYHYSTAQILSGIPYSGVLRYMASDRLNPEKKYPCFVSNQKAYMQEGGSCLIFSLKSIASDILGCDLTTLHISFMQQFNAQNCIAALKNKIALLDKTIESHGQFPVNGMSSQAKEYSYQHANGFFKPTPLRILQRPPLATAASPAV